MDEKKPKKSYAEKHREQIVNGESVAPERDEIETQAKQEEVLFPESTEIEAVLDDEGKDIRTISLPHEFSLKLKFKNRIVNSITQLYKLVLAECSKYTGGKTDLKDILPYLEAAYFAPSVQHAVNNILSTISGIPAAAFEDALDNKNVQKFMGWVNLIIMKEQEAANAAEQAPKKA